MKHLCLLALATILAGCGSRSAEFRSQWSQEIDRPWPGPDYWSNPLQDWRVRNGRLENHVAGGDRNVFLLTRELAPEEGSLHMSVHLGRLEEDTGNMTPGFVGFRVGIQGAFHDYRDSAVRGYGLDAGIATDGRLFIGKLEDSNPHLNGTFSDVTLSLSAEPDGNQYKVTLTAQSDGNTVEHSRSGIPDEWLQGGFALVVHNGRVGETPPPSIEIQETGWKGKPTTQRGGNARFWFRDWTISGSKVRAYPEHAFGPILFAMHTLSRKTLKLTAQMAPVGNAPRRVGLEMREGDSWKRVSEAAIDPDSRTATFKVEQWDDTKDTPYRVVYTMPDYSGGDREYTYSGTVRKDPKDKAKIVVAAFTGNNDMGFPHADVVRHVSHFQPDLLAYTGDNIYERVGEFGTQREPVDAAILDYLRKWYMYGWEYRDLLKDIPAVAIPDDHDVYHGNLWGAGGRHAEGTGNVGQDKGGYTMPAQFVNAVQRTQTSNLPDPYDPTPVEQGITVYYTDLMYGGVSFAVIEDRKWKSAPKVVLPFAKIVNGWAQNPRYDAAKQGDVPGAQLLGPRQEKFLNQWAVDWSGGAWMKVVISQTVFADVVTLPKGTTSDNATPRLRVNKPGEYPDNEEPVQDHDSDGWPQTPRNRALRAMRKGFAFHIAGDQHLGSTIHYGIDDWNDASWALCVPSVANVWPRRWFPPKPGLHHQDGMPRYTGEYHDGFGNRMTVYAVSNPSANGIEPTAINERAPGYGIVEFDRETRKITIANWPRWVDTSQPGARPYEGWPITINQLDNGFPENGLVLQEVSSETDDPVVRVTDQATGNIVYALRIKGRRFTPRVRKPGKYTVEVIEDGKAPRVMKDIPARRS
jgi:alkaline phosphatase D